MSEEMAIKNNIIVPEIGDDPRVRELGEVLNVCSDEKIKSVVEEMKIREDKEKKEREKEKRKVEKKKLKLKGDIKAILKDLKKHHVKIEKNKEMLGYRGKIVHINLPAVGNFNGYKFDYFVSDKLITRKDFENNPELGDKSYSMRDVSELLQAMNKYMKELQGENDGDMDYENVLGDWKLDIAKNNAGNCLKSITGLDDLYWLKDKDESRVQLYCKYFYCYFYPYAIYYNAYLFLRLSN